MQRSLIAVSGGIRDVSNVDQRMRMIETSMERIPTFLQNALRSLVHWWRLDIHPRRLHTVVCVCVFVFVCVCVCGGGGGGGGGG